MRSLPENSATNRSGSGCPASAIAARRNPATQPSVRSSSSARAASGSSIPAASNRSRASGGEKRRSAARSSMSEPASRNRCRPSCGSRRVASTTRNSPGSRASSSSSCASASAELSSCRSSITSTHLPSSEARSDSSRPTTASPSKPGAAPSRCTKPSRPTAPLNASITASQKRWASRSPRSTDTHATRSRSPASSIHDRSSTVLPLPAGAEISVTPPAAPPESRSNNVLRGTRGDRVASTEDHPDE